MNDLDANPPIGTAAATTAATTELTISISPMASTVDGLLSGLSAHEPRPFWQHPAWWQLADEHLFDGQLELVTVSRENGELIVAMPIEREGKALRFPQHPHLTVSDALWFNASSPLSVDSLFNTLFQRLKASSWQHGNLPNTSNIQHGQNQRLWHWKQVRESAWFDTTGDTPIPGKLRRNLARHQRHLEELGELEYRVADSNNAATLPEAMKAFLTLEASGWKAETGTHILNDKNLTSFYNALQSLNTPALHLEIHQLHLANACIATQIALRCGNRLYLIKIAYDESYADYSPGSLLLWQTMQRCVEDNTEQLSLVSAPDWASRWKPNLFPVWHVTRFSNTVQGAICQQAYGFRNLLIKQLRETRNRMRT